MGFEILDFVLETKPDLYSIFIMIFFFFVQISIFVHVFVKSETKGKGEKKNKNRERESEIEIAHIKQISINCLNKSLHSLFNYIFFIATTGIHSNHVLIYYKWKYEKKKWPHDQSFEKRKLVPIFCIKKFVKIFIYLFFFSK